MSKVIQEPETGAQPGVYEAENIHGEKVTMVAQNFPQADALVRQGWTRVKSLDEWKQAELQKLKTSDSKKGK